MLNEFLDEKISQIDAQGLLRTLRFVLGVPSSRIVIDGKKFVNFSSNNYLDLAGNKEINDAVKAALDEYGAAGASSRLVGGTLLIHKMLEEAVASFKNKESALLFPSGYQANAGVISALASKTDNACVIMDKLNHASLWDGAKLGGARIFIYEHCDMYSFEKILKRTKDYKLKLAVSESVFSMDGDIAPLSDFSKLCAQYGAVSVVDEAHSTGVFGKEGRGLAGVDAQIDVIIGTLSKAFAAQGGFVCGSSQLVNYLINKSRAFIYTTAVSPAICAAALKALEIIKKSDDQRILLSVNAKYLREKLSALGFNCGKSQTQIVPIITGDIKTTETLSKKLFENFILAPAIKPPTVPDGQARIRISLTAGHTRADIENLTAVLEKEKCIKSL
ncbi:MAG: pyridoxal phosphate-dependent aminotransferase family protein [Endomicrobium sp.]|jgi:8-amino-7-oxononanoate synthase|nr:pyridoxal phosphate-dependent aminotransferase family protein [Endomicrobium sp.]